MTARAMPCDRVLLQRLVAYDYSFTVTRRVRATCSVAATCSCRGAGVLSLSGPPLARSPTAPARSGVPDHRAGRPNNVSARAISDLARPARAAFEMVKLGAWYAVCLVSAAPRAEAALHGLANVVPHFRVQPFPHGPEIPRLVAHDSPRSLTAFSARAIWGGSGLGGRRLRLPFALRGLASRDRGYAMLHRTVRSDGRNAGASDGVTLPGNRAVHLVDEEWRMP